VDDKVIQVLAVPINPQADVSDAKPVLLAHQKSESEFMGEGGWKELVDARQWLAFPSGEPALYWEMHHPEPKTEQDSKATKHLFGTTLNGRSVILVSVPVFRGMDEQECAKWLQETVLSVVRHESADAGAVEESTVAAEAGSSRQVAPADASVVLINADLASARERKESSVVVVEPEYLLMVLQLAVTLEKNPMVMTELTDGQASHMVNFQGYDAATGRFLYWEPRGAGSFLSEGNNIAGVKAEAHPEQRKMFYVKRDDLQTVVRGIITEAQYYRLMGATGDLKLAVQEFGALHEKQPDGLETSQERLLQAGTILAEMDQPARAQNCFAVCYQLYPKSARALAGIAGIFVKVDQPEPAINFYRSATELLADDESLSDEQRKGLFATWTAELVRLESPAQNSEKEPPAD